MANKASFQMEMSATASSSRKLARRGPVANAIFPQKEPTVGSVARSGRQATPLVSQANCLAPSSGIQCRPFVESCQRLYCGYLRPAFISRVGRVAARPVKRMTCRCPEQRHVMYEARWFACRAAKAQLLTALAIEFLYAAMQHQHEFKTFGV